MISGICPRRQSLLNGALTSTHAGLCIHNARRSSVALYCLASAEANRAANYVIWVGGKTILGYAKMKPLRTQICYACQGKMKPEVLFFIICTECGIILGIWNGLMNVSCHYL